MKKALCLMMVAMLMLALGVTIYARYEACTYCGGKMVEDIEREYIGKEPCEVTGDPDMLEPVYKVTYIFECPDCGYNENYFDTEQECSH